MEQKCNDICNYLSTTYDARVINDCDDLKPLFKHALESHESKQTVLSRLVKNQLEKSLDKEVANRSIIRGPLYFSQYSDTTGNYRNMNFYLFGEQHDPEKICGQDEDETEIIDIDDYFSILLSKTPLFLDIFIEMPGHKELDENRLQNGSISKIVEKLKRCIDLETRNEKTCSLSRIHYSDIRMYSNKETDDGQIDSMDKLLYLFQELYREIQKAPPEMSKDEQVNHIKPQLYSIFTSPKVKPELIKFIRFLLAKDNYLDYFKKQIRLNSKVSKDLSKSYLGSDIFTYIINRVSTFVDTNEYVKKVVSITKIGQESGEYITKNNCLVLFNYAYVCLTYLNGMIMDIYTLSRMFKFFEFTKPDQPPAPQNVIFYGGEYHAKSYAKFLEYLGFHKHIIPYDTINNHCIRITPPISN